MAQLQENQWKLHLRHGGRLSDGISEGMIVRLDKHMSRILIAYDDEPQFDDDDGADTTGQLVYVGRNVPHAHEYDSGAVIGTSSDDEVRVLVI